MDMHRFLFKTAIAAALAFLTLGAPAAPPRPVAAASEPASAALPAGQKLQRNTLRELGANGTIELRGLEDNLQFPLSVRLDESVISARLNLIYTLSPGLIPELSHLKVLVNDEVLATLALPRDKLGQPQQAHIDLDPRVFTEYAKLRIQFIGHYSPDCEFPQHSTLWANLSPDSALELRTRLLPLRNDLSLLPAPWLDPRDSRPIEVPFVLGALNRPELWRDAAVLASWFGARADYRSARFPVSVARLPDRHGVVLALNGDRFEGLTLPEVQRPTLAVMAHPKDERIKLLLIQGRDADQLRTAVQALVLDQVVLTGERLEVGGVKLPQPRQPHDSPRLTPTGRLVRVGELMRPGQSLQVGGLMREPIRVPLNLPGDLFIWEHQGLPLDLRFRYTPAREPGEAQLRVQVDDKLVQSFGLQIAAHDTESHSLNASTQAGSLLGRATVMDQRNSVIPPYLMPSSQELRVHFDMPPRDEGKCRSNGLVGGVGSLDPDSTLDLSRVAHFATLPDLQRFARRGFPFTRLGDLGETALVLPDVPDAPVLTAALALAGRLGTLTGLPAIRLRTLPASQVAEAGDADLLILTTGSSPALPQGWLTHLPVQLDGQRRNSLGLDFDLPPNRQSLFGQAQAAIAQGASTETRTDGALAVWMGFESPLHAERSAVLLHATTPSILLAAAERWLDPAVRDQMQGDVVVLRDATAQDGAIESFRTGSVYTVGSLPLWQRIWFELHSRPWLLIVLGVLLSGLAALALFGRLRRQARQRLQS